MKQDMMFRIAIERCITGWHYEAIAEEQKHLMNKSVEQLSNIHQNIEAMRHFSEAKQQPC